jgi:hypothetical protein
MADGILDGWVRKGVPKDQLPQLQVESYYGNPTKVYSRQGFPSRNGWEGDQTPEYMSFTNKAGSPQKIRQHLMYQSQRPVETKTETEKSESSDDVLVSST